MRDLGFSCPRSTGFLHQFARSITTMISAFPRVADHVPLKTVHLELLHVPMSLTVQDSILFREAAEGRSLDARPATGVTSCTNSCATSHE